MPLSKLGKNTKRLKQAVILILITVFGTSINSTQVLAAIPTTINYQGVLKSNLNVPITSATTIQFSIYNSTSAGLPTDTPSASGPLLWTETYNAGAGNCAQITPNSVGQFSTRLGSCVTFPSYLNFSNGYYLGIKIGTNSEATPRVVFSSVPYSENVRNITFPSNQATAFSANDTLGNNYLSFNSTIGNPSVNLNQNTTIGDSTKTLTIGAILQGGTPLVFEGNTVDANRTSIQVADPTGNRVITIPDNSGTVAVGVNPLGPLTLSASGILDCPTCAISSGGSLNDAYNFGGPGVGKNITADSGAVNIIVQDGPGIFNGLTLVGDTNTTQGILFGKSDFGAGQQAAFGFANDVNNPAAGDALFANYNFTQNRFNFALRAAGTTSNDLLMGNALVENAGTQIQNYTGSSNIFALASFGVGNIVQHVGNGSPEGVTIANSGSIYFRVDGTSLSEQLYVKTTDGGNTGWLPVASAGGGITSADNGLTLSSATNVQLGGVLAQDTTIDGNGGVYDLTFQDLKSFSIGGGGVGSIGDIGNTTIRISTSDELQIRTPLVSSNLATNGYILTLQDATTGRVEFTDPALLPNGAWSLLGNAGTNSATNFLGTTDGQDLAFRTNNNERLRITQYGRLDFSNVGNNIFLDGSNESITGINNIALGENSLLFLTAGNSNVGLGVSTLLLNSVGNQNTAIGQAAGIVSTGDENTFIGYASGTNLSSGNRNVSIGSFTDFANSTGSNQLNIANAIFGTGLTGSVSSPAGNIGIGTSTPNTALEVASGLADVSGLRLTNLVSTSPTTVGQTIGVDALGNIVTVASSGGISSINAQSGPALSLVIGSSGTAPNIATTLNTLTVNIPDASNSASGIITTGLQTIAGDKIFNGQVTVNNCGTGTNIFCNGGNIFASGTATLGTLDDSDLTVVRNGVEMGRFYNNYSVTLAGAVALTTNQFNVGLGAGVNAASAYSSNFLGPNAGEAANNAYEANFFGPYAGFRADSANNSNFIGSNAGVNAANANNANFFGTSAGSGATSAERSNFLGSNAGISAVNAYRSNFLGDNTGQSATNAYDSNFLGGFAGANATDAYNSNFFGYFAGANATNARYANFIGTYAGFNAVNAADSNFIGNNAGSEATFAANSNFFGSSAGAQATNAVYSNFIGSNAGNSATSAEYSNFFGNSAGVGATNANGSNFVGNTAGYSAANAYASNFFGSSAGYFAANANSSNFFGSAAGSGATDANDSNFFGNSAGVDAISASNSNFFGRSAGNNATNARSSIFIGERTGQAATNAANSIFIGASAGNSDTVDNTGGSTSILIGSSTSTGGFRDSIVLGANGTNTSNNQFLVPASYNNWNIGGVEYILPNAQGGAGQVLTNDGSGNLSWAAGGGGGGCPGSTTIFCQGGNSFGNIATLGTNDLFDFNLITNSTPRISILSGGDVGIGNNSPTARLEISSGVANVSGLKFTNFNSSSTPNTGSVVGVDFNGNIIRLANSSISVPLSGITAATTSVAFNNGANAIGWQWNTLTTQNAMAFDSSSITTGTLFRTRTFNAGLNSTNGLAYIANEGTSTSGMLFRARSNVDANSGLSVLANGRVGIGNAAPTMQLDVTDTTTTNVAIFNGSGATQCTVVTGTGVSCTSDASLKTNIATLNNGALGIIQGLNPVTYNWIDGDGQNQVGFIAQEVQQLVPEAVTTSSNGKLSLNTTTLTPYIVKALQEQQVEIEALHNAITLLSGGVDLTAIQAQIESNSSQVTALAAAVQAIQLGTNLESLTVQNLTATNIIASLPITYSSNFAGTAVISAGQTQVNVVYGQALAKAPLAQVTPIGEENIGTQFVVTNQTATGFTIKIAAASTSNLSFNWQTLLIN